MIIKSIAIIAFALIIISLGIALFNLVKNKDREHSEKIVKALTVRISLSILLFIFVVIALATGLLKPEGIGAKIQTIRQATPTLPAVK
ncbi:MAG: twin transmembrane helix small protein [Methylovulum miyakonense]|uniref:twin transmembrane helix small protein n=1 Tax=Methylovulum miyakonense TaxID=645578 RepID=UPI003BB5CD3D